MKIASLTFLVFCYSPVCLLSATHDTTSSTSICRLGQLRLTVGPYGGAMGGQYTEIIFRNVSNSQCRLTSAFLEFQQLDAKGLRMPIMVHLTDFPGNRENNVFLPLRWVAVEG
jgi:hypothetical protein